MTSSVHPPGYWLFPIGLSLAFLFAYVPGDWPLYGLLAVGVAVFGIPHGSLDTAVAERYIPLQNIGEKLIFSVAYLSIGGAVILFWWYVPTTALAAFLLYSAFHFGDDVSPRLGRVGGTGYGLLVLALPIAAQPSEVEPIFLALGAMNADLLIRMAPWALAVGAPFLLVSLLTSVTCSTSDWRDPMLLGLGALLLHPLAYFVAYFCFLHSPRHMENTSRDLGLNTWRDRLLTIAPTTLITYVLIGSAVPFLIHLPPDAILLRIVFISLAALTVPHIVLETFAGTRRRRQPPAVKADKLCGPGVH